MYAGQQWTERKFDELGKLLLQWWQRNKRDFPWRKESDAYRILVAEILLRKTDVRKVMSIYERLLERYPDISSLAKADIEELANLLKPIGLYRVRARQMVEMARIMLERYNSRIPSEPGELGKLPGVGSYIANALACFAYGRQVPAVDANVARVVLRLMGLKPKGRPHEDKMVWEFTGNLCKRFEAKEINLALIDFAALVCTAANPRCDSCPLAGLCASRGGWNA